MYGRADGAVNGHRNDTLRKPTYLDKARGKVRRYLAYFQLTSLPPVATP
jgi:hypothetical protein